MRIIFTDSYELIFNSVIPIEYISFDYSILGNHHEIGIDKDRQGDNIIMLASFYINKYADV